VASCYPATEGVLMRLLVITSIEMKTLGFKYYLGFVILGLLASCGNDKQQNLSETELNSWNNTGKLFILLN